MVGAPEIAINMVLSTPESTIHLRGKGRVMRVELDSFSGVLFLIHTSYIWIDSLNRFLEKTGWQVELFYRGLRINSVSHKSLLLRLLRFFKNKVSGQQT